MLEGVSMRIAILGAYGNAGRAVARLLRTHTSHDLLLLGRDPAKLTSLVEETRRIAGRGAVDGRPLPTASTREARADCLRGAQLLVVTAPLSANVGPWAEAALDAGCDWLDVLLSVREKWAALSALAPRAQTEGRCLVTDGGVHPGVPGALVRLAAGRIPARSVRVAMRFGLIWRSLDFSDATIEEFADELTRYDPRTYHGGEWVSGWRWARSFDFGSPVGKATCAPMYLEELGEVQRSLPGLRDVGFWVAGFGPVVDYGAMPAAALLAKAGPWARPPSARLLAWALRRFGATRGGSIVLLEAEGDHGASLRLRLECEDGYVLTAAPPVAAILQWDEARRPGLHAQACFVDPERLVSDLPSLGVAVVTGRDEA